VKIALILLSVWPCFAAEPCAPCHAKIAASYARTAMGQSFSRAGNIPLGHYFHAASDTHFEMIERGGQFFQRRYQLGFGGSQTNIDEKSIDYVMGSGNHVKTFLHRTLAGELQELPLAWYAENGGYFAMNPGYDKPDQPNARRKIDYECMFCHNAYPAIPPDKATSREFVFSTVPEGIDCARCHGAGERHAEIAKSGAPREAIRAAIVNPARLTADRRMEVCLQCHLETTSFPFPHAIVRFDREPFSYRPGERLGDFELYFDHPGPERFQIVSSAYRLRMSRCFLRSAISNNEAMQCTTCHDPHGVSNVAQIERTCLKCHAGLRAEHRALSGCTGCHMPKQRTKDVVHAVMTDHWIRTKPPAMDPDVAIAEPHGGEIMYRGEVLPYYPQGRPPGRFEELYLALAQVREGNNLERGVPRLQAAIERNPGARAEFLIGLADVSDPAKAIPLYEEALRRQPESATALLGLGNALDRVGKAERATEAFQRLDPESAIRWWKLGEIYSKTGRLREAVAALEKSIAINPEAPETYYALGLVLAQGVKDNKRSEMAFREAIRLRPDDSAAHMNLAIVLYDANQHEEAAYHFERALWYRPDYALGHLNYGLMLKAWGKPEKAAEHLRKAADGSDAAIRNTALDALSKK
jgi:tetratricopeptide (TPR) repeat protein